MKNDVGSVGGSVDPAILSGIQSDIQANKDAISVEKDQIKLNCDAIGL